MHSSLILDSVVAGHKKQPVGEYQGCVCVIFWGFFFQLIFALLGSVLTARTLIGYAVIAVDHGSTVLASEWLL